MALEQCKSRRGTAQHEIASGAVCTGGQMLVWRHSFGPPGGVWVSTSLGLDSIFLAGASRAFFGRRLLPARDGPGSPLARQRVTNALTRRSRRNRATPSLQGAQVDLDAMSGRFHRCTDARKSLDLSHPVSFFQRVGAGSGRVMSLSMSLRHQQIGQYGRRLGRAKGRMRQGPQK
jgi:hypothetical protein